MFWISCGFVNCDGIFMLISSWLPQLPFIRVSRDAFSFLGNSLYNSPCKFIFLFFMSSFQQASPNLLWGERRENGVNGAGAWDLNIARCGTVGCVCGIWLRKWGLTKKEVSQRQSKDYPGELQKQSASHQGHSHCWKSPQIGQLHPGCAWQELKWRVPSRSQTTACL